MAAAMADRTIRSNTLPMAVEAAEEAAVGVILIDPVETLGSDVCALAEATGINAAAPEVTAFADAFREVKVSVLSWTVGLTVAVLATTEASISSM